MAPCRSTIVLVGVALAVVTHMQTVSAAWPETSKSGCMLLNKKNGYEVLTGSCVADEKVCTAGKDADPSQCSKCASYDAPAKPFPALTQCYKFNQDSCCLSGHDSTIKDAYESLLSTTCLREFPPLEYFFCLGCHNKQMDYVDIDEKKIHVCPSFADTLWKEQDYDRCGLKLGDSDWPFIKPWAEYANATEFLNVPDIKPPYFGDYEVVIDSTDSDNCFTNGAWRRAIGVVTLLALMLGVLSLA